MPQAHDKDPRTDDELFAASLAGDEDERAWAAVVELQRRGTRAVFDGAKRLLHAPSELERARGADVLGQLGVGPVPPPGEDAPVRPFQAQSVESHLGALRTETSPRVLNSIGVALGHLQDPRAVGALAPLRNHPEPAVRFGVVFGLSGHPDALAVDALIELSGDGDGDVRNWATFALGSQIEDVDTPALREALIQRLSDTEMEIRGEALVGLAVRNDSRILEPLRRELGGQQVGVLALEAAGALGDRSVLPLLEAIRDSGGEASSQFRQTLLAAIASLKNSTAK